MGKATISFESAGNLPNGPVAFTFAVDDAYDHDLASALLASEKYGYINDGVTRRAATFEEALGLFAKDAVGDRIVDATNQFRIAKAQAIAAASVSPVVFK